MTVNEEANISNNSLYQPLRRPVFSNLPRILISYDPWQKRDKLWSSLLTSEGMQTDFKTSLQKPQGNALENN